MPRTTATLSPGAPRHASWLASVLTAGGSPEPVTSGGRATAVLSWPSSTAQLGVPTRLRLLVPEGSPAAGRGGRVLLTAYGSATPGAPAIAEAPDGWDYASSEDGSGVLTARVPLSPGTHEFVVTWGDLAGRVTVLGVWQGEDAPQPSVAVISVLPE